MELVGTALSPGKLMLRLERLERPSHQERNSNALGGAAAGERGWRGAGSGVTYDPRQFISLQYLAHGSLTKPSTANYRLSMQIQAMSAAHNSSNGWNRRHRRRPQTRAAGPSFIRAEERVDGATNEELQPPRNTQTCWGQRGLGVPGRLSRDSQDTLRRAGHMAIDQDRSSSTGPGWGWVGTQRQFRGQG